MLDAQDVLSAGLLFSTACFAGSVVALCARRPKDGEVAADGGVPVLLVLAVALALVLATRPLAASTLVPIAIAASICVAALAALRDFTPVGRLLLASHLQLMGWLLPYGAWFIWTIDVSTATRALLLAGYPFVVLTLPVGLISTYGTWEVLCRRRWRRPRTPPPPRARDRFPKVSLHVPVRSEPPDVVIRTLDSLARLDYPDYEVIVVDNNTVDPSLWRPVEAHCERLGGRFRFFHVEGLQGAKGGALNFALRNTAPDAELIGVVDSDYETEPDFLADLIGFFDDARVGFVQTPHEYRGWEDSTYLRWCRWEYKLFFHTTMVTMNERDAALIVGTMCLIRKRSIEAAGGWSEWCLTEDSELSIRIHAAGYSSVYVDHPYGRGLIPETLAGYKSQRFRWTYGPIQELKAHLRLFLPAPFGRPSRLTRAHKLHHLHHGLDRLKIGLGVALVPFNIAAVVSILAHHEVVGVPTPLWLAASSVVISGFVLKWQVYRMKGCGTADALGALVASKALSHAITMASLSALLARPATWRRTDKFRTTPRSLRALTAARDELVVGALGLLLPVAAFVVLPYSPLLAMMLLAALYESANYLAAPALALLGERHVRSVSAPSSPTVPIVGQDGVHVNAEVEP